MIVDFKNGRFYLDPTAETFGQIHAQIIELLKDSEKLERFKQLLETDSNCAYSIFVNENNLYQ